MATSATFIATFTSSGSLTAPTGLVSSPAVYATGEGGNSGTSSQPSGSRHSGGGGGGGAFGGEPALGGVTSGTVLTITIGAGGTGTPTTVTGGSVTVEGENGTSGSNQTAGGGGTAGSNTIAFAGGPGANGSTSAAQDGGGGGGSAGSTGAGGSASGTTGGAAGTGAAGPPSLAGAIGGAGGSGTGNNGNAPGSGAGGPGDSNTEPAADGAAGQVVITWAMNSPAVLAAATTGGVYTWTAPAGITSVSWTISGTATFDGNSSSGSETVTPGNAYTITVAGSSSLTITWGDAAGGSVSPYTGGQVYQSQRRKRSQLALTPPPPVTTSGGFALGALAFTATVNVANPVPLLPYTGGQVARQQRSKRSQQVLPTGVPASSFGLGALGFSGTAKVAPTASGGFKLAGLGFAGTAKETEPDSGSFGLGALAFSGTALVDFPFPRFPLGLKYELLLNGTWTDITDYVYQRDPNVITRARPDETQAVTPCQMTLTLNNRDGRFSPKNTAGAYYPYLARNVQLRVSITNQTSSSTGVTYTGYRFWGEVSTWPPQWDPSQSDIYCQITASGILRRYQQSKALGSPLYQYWTTRPSGADPLIYYPMEDAGFLSSADAQAFTAGYIAPRVTNSADPLIQAMAVSGTPEFATSTVLGGSAALPYIEAATVTSGDLTVSPTPAQLNVVFVMVADPNAADDVAIITINPNVSPASGLDQVVLLYRDAAEVISLELIGYSAGPVTLFDSGSVSTLSVGGLPVVLCVSITTTAVTLYATYPALVNGELMPTPVQTVFTYATTTNFTSSTGGFTIGAPGNTAIGHVAVCDFFPDLLGIATAACGCDGEPALVRFDRLCAERGITTPARTDYTTAVSAYSPSALWKLSDAFGSTTILNTATGHSDTITAAFPGIIASPVINVTSRHDVHGDLHERPGRAHQHQPVRRSARSRSWRG